MSKQKKHGATGAIAVLSAGVIAVAAASYLFFGPEGKKYRNSLKGWMVKMKGEIIEKMEESKDMSEANYIKIVDSVSAKYAKSGKVTETEVRFFANVLKQQWSGIVKAHNKMLAVKKAVKAVTNVAKKEMTKPSVVKKVAPKKKTTKK